jgi:transcription elongation GreA/GreB family factor
MSTKISLQFKTEYEAELLERGVQVRVVRLIASVGFKTPTGWSQPLRAVVDTGNPVTILPEITHSHIERKIVLPEPVSIFGVGEGHIHGHLAEVEMAFN